MDEGHYSVVHEGVWRGQRVAVKLWKTQALSPDLLTLFSREVTNMRCARVGVAWGRGDCASRMRDGVGGNARLGMVSH